MKTALRIKMSAITAIAIAILGTAAGATIVNATPRSTDPSTTPIAQRYERAARVLDANLAGGIRNATITPNWIGDGQSFWYRRDGDAGPEWVIVDAATGERRPAFDIARLRQAYDGSAAERAGMRVLAIHPDAAGFSVTAVSGSRTVRCTVPAYTCAANAAPPRATDAAWSPRGDVGIRARDNNLYLHRAGDTDDVALTSDGVAHFAYGATPGTSLFAIPTARSTQPRPPVGIHWSPDGSRLIGMRIDERRVEPYPFVEWVPQDGSHRPKLWQPRIPILGDAERGVQEVFTLDPATRRKTIVRLPLGWDFHAPAFHWSADGRRAFGLAQTRGAKQVALVEITIDTGDTRMVATETAKTFATFNAFVYNPPNVRILERSNEALWFSQADGWGQIHLYDLARGKLKRKLTQGSRAVRDIVGIDEARRLLYFTAGGSDADTDPYQLRLYVVSLDGGAARLLTPEAGVHTAALAPIGNAAPATSAHALSPNGQWIVQSWSSLDTPPVTLLRAASDGRVVATLETADASGILTAGWTPPTRVKLRAADGKTPIWGTVYFPPDMQPGRRYPVINAMYGGPQITNAPADFLSAVTALNPISRSSLARLGFIVVTIDGRGTPGRSKAFNDASYGGEFAEPELADNVAGMRQLAERFGNFDLDRVGIYGHSFGGYTSARAILTWPDVFKVAVSSAGPHNFQGFYPVETWFGIPDYGTGSPARPNAAQVSKEYARLDSARFANNLKGKLLLVYGDLDENALPAVTLQLTDALIRANKRFDLLHLPNRDHNFFRTDAYYTQRMWDYFVEHLLGEEPPADFKLTLKPMRDPSGY